MSGPFFIVPIVEGHGEVEAVPILLRRIAQTVEGTPTVQINPPIRVKTGSFINDGEYFGRYIELASRKAAALANSCVLVLLDSEDACPATLGPEILAKARQVRPDTQFLIVLAHREYETWFLAAARSLRGCGNLPEHLEPPNSPESLRDAKGWLSAQMRTTYNEPNDQPKFTARFSFDEGSQVPSFGRALRKITEFLRS